MRSVPRLYKDDYLFQLSYLRVSVVRSENVIVEAEESSRIKGLGSLAFEGVIK